MEKRAERMRDEKETELNCFAGFWLGRRRFTTVRGAIFIRFWFPLGFTRTRLADRFCGRHRFAIWIDKLGWLAVAQERSWALRENQDVPSTRQNTYLCFVRLAFFRGSLLRSAFFDTFYFCFSRRIRIFTSWVLLGSLLTPRSPTIWKVESDHIDKTKSLTRLLHSPP